MMIRNRIPVLDISIHALRKESDSQSGSITSA